MEKLRTIISVSACMIVLNIFTPQCHALIINEILASPNEGYEWVELYNNADTFVDLSGYSLFDLTGKDLKIGQLILGPDEISIATSEGVLNNSGDTIFLRNDHGVVTDTVTYGAVQKDESYSLCDQVWIKTSPTYGNKRNNCPSILQNSPAPSPSTPSGTPTTIPIPPQQPTTAIILSEVMVNSKNEPEWIELYNASDKQINLVGWHIDDGPGGSKALYFNLHIGPLSYATYDLPLNIFNNAGDTVELKDSFGNIVQSFSYQESIDGFSLGVPTLTSKSFCLQYPTKGAPNDECYENSNSEEVDQEEQTLGLSDSSNSPQAGGVPTKHITPRALPHPGNMTRSQTSPTSTGQPSGSTKQKTINNSRNEDNASLTGKAVIKSSMLSLSSLTLSGFLSLAYRLFMKVKKNQYNDG